MDWDLFGGIGIIIGVCLIWFFVFLCVGIVAGYIATYLCVTGIIWWAVTVVLFLVIWGMIGIVYRIGSSKE